MAGLHIILHEGESCLLELLLGVLRQQGAALAAQALDIDDHQTAVLFGKLEQLQLLRQLQSQVKGLVHDLQQTVLLRLGRYNDSVLGKQLLQVVHGDFLAGNGALADAGEHGVGQIQADIDLLAGLGIAHIGTSSK